MLIRLDVQNLIVLQTIFMNLTIKRTLTSISMLKVFLRLSRILKRTENVAGSQL